MLSYPMYEDFRDNFVDRGAAPGLTRVSVPVAVGAPATPVFSGMFARRTVAMNVGTNGQTERVPGELVSGTYFQVLGVGAAIGRVITPDDDKERGGSPVAVLSYDYWRNRFGARPADRRQDASRSATTPLTIIGVSQAGFDGVDIGYVPSIRVPLMMKAQMTPNWDDVVNRRSRWVNVFGRLKPGVTLAQAQGGAAAVLPRHPRAGGAGAAVQQHDGVHARAVPQGTGRSAAGGAGTIADPAAAVATAVAAAWHRRRRAADRVRQRREPADRARDGAPEGDRRPPRPRRQPRPHRRPAARRERDARGDWRAARPRARVVDDAVPARLSADVGYAARDLGIDRQPDPAVQLRAVAGHRPGVRPGAGAAIDASRTSRRR